VHGVTNLSFQVSVTMVLLPVPKAALPICAVSIFSFLSQAPAPISARPACLQLNPVYGMRADGQETAQLTVLTLYYAKATVLGLRSGIAVVL
jgi:hypothetical protein